MRRVHIHNSGFTIVELLVVVVVVGILAAITAVAYVNINSRANATVLEADLSSAKKQIQLAKVESDNYPANIDSLNNGQGLGSSDGVVYEYSVNNGVDPKTYCLTASRSGVSYFINQDGAIEDGACPGHTYGGPPEYTFTNLQETQVTSIGTKYWRWGASSADGTKLAAVEANGGTGYIHTSADSGATWTQRTSAGARNWGKIASSADGTKLAAIIGELNYGYIYVSLDSGATWTPTGTNNRWSAITISGDGSTFYAADSVSVSGGIYRSTNNGGTWTMVRALTQDWNDIKTSYDGQKTVAAPHNNRLNYSADGGASWTNLTNTTFGMWMRVAISSNGNVIIGALNNGALFTSANSGGSWTQRSALGTGSWYAATMSDDGTKMFVAKYNGAVYTSIDSGANWIERTNFGTGSWIGFASNADGTQVLMPRTNNYLRIGRYD